MTEQTGKGSYLWHLERAAIQQQLGDRSARRGYLEDAERAYRKAQKHRDEAAILDLEARAA